MATQTIERLQETSEGLQDERVQEVINRFVRTKGDREKYALVLDQIKEGRYFNPSLVEELFLSGEDVIDCSSDPFVPEGFELVKHNRQGLIPWDPKRISVLTKINSSKNDNLLNANVLDFLLKNPELIPKSWKKRFIFFTGTVYRKDGKEIVRGLVWGKGPCGKLCFCHKIDCLFGRGEYGQTHKQTDSIWKPIDLIAILN